MGEPIKRNLAEQLAWLSQNRAAAAAFAPPTPGAMAPALASAACGPSSMAPDVALTATISKIRASEPTKWALAPGRSPAELFARFDPVPKLPPAQAPPSDSLQLILYGYSLATFTALPQLAFTRAVASVLSVPTSYVTILSFSNIVSSSRRLLSDALGISSTTSSMLVTFSVYSSFSADSLVSQLLTNNSLNTALATTYGVVNLSPASVTDITAVSATSTSEPPKSNKKTVIIAGVLGSFGGLFVAGALAVVYVRMRKPQRAYLDADLLAKPELSQPLIVPEAGVAPPRV
jgi:hypothetical protein